MGELGKRRRGEISGVKIERDEGIDGSGWEEGKAGGCKWVSGRKRDESAGWREKDKEKVRDVGRERRRRGERRVRGLGGERKSCGEKEKGEGRDGGWRKRGRERERG